MKIFFKYIAKSMIEKKARFCLLILAIALSSGLLVSITGAVDVAIKSFKKPMTETFEGKDIAIGSKNGEQFIDIDSLKEDGVKEIQGEILINGRTDDDEHDRINIQGRKIENINKDIIIEGSLENLKGETCIISKRISEERGVAIGESINLLIAGEKKSFEVIAICKNEGRFYTETKDNFGIIIPYEYLANKYNVEGKYNFVMAEKAEVSVKDSVEKFNESNINFEANELFDEELIKGQMESFTSVLYLMLIIVVAMSAIIIYGSFKLTITERLSIIGTFLSQGATNWTVEKILFLESIGYGVIGGLFGNLLGFGGLYIINYIISPLREYGVIEKLVVEPSYFIIGMIFAVILSFISALIPIRRIRKLEVKEVILNNVNISMNIGWTKFIIGSIIMIISLFIGFIDKEWARNLSGVFILISIIGLTLMYPKLIDIITNSLFKVFRGRSKSLVFGLNNLRTSKVLMGNITLIVISMLSIFMITSIGSSMQKMVIEAYSGLNFDISVSGIQGVPGVGGETVTEKIVEKLKESENIDANSIIIHKGGFAMVSDTMVKLQGVDKEKFKGFNGYLELDGKEYSEMYDEFANEEGNVLIITDKLKKLLDVSVGDTITLNANEIEKDFKIAGSINGKLYNNGQFVFIDNKVMEREFGIIEANEITCNTYIEADIVKEEIKPIIRDFGAKAYTKSEQEEANQQGNQMILDVLSIFSYMAMFIAALGVLNNIIIGFLQRKRELAVLSSVGMSTGNRAKMLLSESLLSVIWAIIIAVPYSFLGLKLLSNTLIQIGMPLDVQLDINAVPVYFIAAVIVILLATIPILFKSRKLSIIEELKYE